MAIYCMLCRQVIFFLIMFTLLSFKWFYTYRHTYVQLFDSQQLMHVSQELCRKVLLQTHCKGEQLHLHGKINIVSKISVSVVMKVNYQGFISGGFFQWLNKKNNWLHNKYCLCPILILHYFLPQSVYDFVLLSLIHICTSFLHTSLHLICLVLGNTYN